jgi:alginate O-acetyltransferase complex protein AlgI
MTEIRWVWMWALAAAIFAACKGFTWARNRAGGFGARDAAYLFLWPGMDARAFLDKSRRPSPPRTAEWLFAAAKTALGAALVWIAAPLATRPLLKGWIGLLGVIFVLHFGTFHLASLAWRRAGVQAEPIMRAPILSSSLGDLWGKRWNLGFHDVARVFIYAPLAPRLGAAGAALAVFVASGLVHDLVISVPAGGGYGLPTAYFAVQGLGVLVERKLRFTSRIFAILIAAGPAFWLFHPPFVRNVFLPFLEAIS